MLKNFKLNQKHEIRDDCSFVTFRRKEKLTFLSDNTMLTLFEMTLICKAKAGTRKFSEFGNEKLIF
jgi:hypothetical protein